MDNKTDARDMLRGLPVPDDFSTALLYIFQACYDVMMDKRKARGTSNIFEQGSMGLLHRVRQDKLARIQATLEKKEIIKLALSLNVDPEIRVAMRHDIRFEERGATLHDADYIDDLVDAINYCAIMISLAFDWWGLPAEESNNTKPAGADKLGIEVKIDDLRFLDSLAAAEQKLGVEKALGLTKGETPADRGVR